MPCTHLLAPAARPLAALLLALGLVAGCSSDDTGSAVTGSGGFGGSGGHAGQGQAGSGQAGSGTAGSGPAGQGQAGQGQAGQGQAGQGQAGSGQAGGTAGGSCAVDGQSHQGDGTYYDATGAGNCSFPATPNDLMVGAMNQADYLGSAVCGSCARVTGPAGAVTVRVVDRCPECKPGDIDLSPQAFALLSPLEKGRIPITWSYVACEVTGSLQYHFKDGSSQWWTAVQVRNHRYPIAKFEYQKPDGTFKVVDRVDYNFFVDPAGMGVGPLTFRVTDTLGHVIEDSNVPLLDNADAPGGAQFPACTP